MKSLACLLALFLGANHHAQEPLFGQDRVAPAGSAGVVYTSMLLPLDTSGEVEAPKDLPAQLARLIRDLEQVLRGSGAELNTVLRLTLYLVEADAAPEASRVLQGLFPEGAAPAVTYVHAALPFQEEGVVACLDAIAAPADTEPSAADEEAAQEIFRLVERAPSAVRLPAGPAAFISGRAASNESFEAAVRGTLEQLAGDLKTVGARREGDAVALKVFLNDITRAAEVAEIAGAFFGESMPVLSIVEWKQTRAELPVEIELVARAPQPPAGETRPQVEWFESSPHYSKIARVNRGELLFVSGLYGTAEAPADQVRTVFKRLETMLRPHGSDLAHLLKATYYVSGDEVVNQLREQRPGVYPLGHSPAASLISVRGVGHPARSLVMDMIAVKAE